mgnify:CR=1 FL=1
MRWVINKEEHAQDIIDTINNYYLTQRVKSKQKDYTGRLIKHHAIMIAAMKIKQNAEINYAQELINSIDNIAAYYPEPHEH